MKRAAWIVLAVVAAGVILRSLRLSWQPIWWDEGYSVYFATESLPRMLWLTARDIHPPLYYALLHAWLGVTGAPSPENGRILSILFAGLALPLQYWLARAMFRCTAADGVGAHCCCLRSARSTCITARKFACTGWR